MKLLCTTVCTLAITTASFADVFTVDDDGKADFDNIQAAIDASSDGDEILVMPGTYSGSGAYQVCQTLGKAVWIHGSDGPEVTVIDGEGIRRGFLCNSGETYKTIVDGFTITNASGNTGGGVTIFNSSPSITNCVIVNNTTSQNGGGIYVFNGSPIVTNCTISNNHADNSGGGIVSINSSSMNISDTVICGNTPDQVNGGFVDGGGNTIAEFCVPDADWTVDDDGNDYPDADFDNIQDAINAATAGDEILVFPGTYTSVEDQVVDMKDGVWLHSSEGADATVIDGEGSRRGIYCNNDGSNTIIEGFTITNGHDYYGGGVYARTSNPTLADCIFENNSATDGGGMYIYYYSNPTLINCTFEGNTSTYGGGITSREYSNPVITNCIFTSNNASARGGGMNAGGGSPTLENCTFDNNSASSGGGMSNNVNGNSTLTDCTFENNTAASGGGMRNYDSSPTLTGCTFTGNTAHSGAGIQSVTGSTTTLENCTFTGNTAEYGGGLSDYDNSNSTLTYCTFTGNTANNRGGGILCNNFCSPTVTNCTFTGNTATNYGGGMCITGNCFPLLLGCVFENNTADRGGGVYNYFYCISTLTNCTFAGNTSENAAGMWNHLASVHLFGANTFDELFLHNLSAADFSAGSTCDVTGSTILYSSGVMSFDIDDLDTSSSLNVSQAINWIGGLAVSNNSGSLLTSNVGDVIPLAQGPAMTGSFDSIVFPLMPKGLGLQLIEYPSLRGGETEMAVEVIEVEDTQFANPFTGDLDSTPIDIRSFDADDDGTDELAVLFDGEPGGVAVFAVSEDSAPTLIDGFSAEVGSGPVNLDAGDLDGDGLEDLLVANSASETITVLLTTFGTGGTLTFTESTINTTNMPSCVAIIDWDGDTDLDAVVGQTDPSGYQVVLDVAASSSFGTLFSIPQFQLPDGSYVSDPPTCVDGGDQNLTWGFVGATQYGRVHKAAISGALEVVGELNSNTVMIEAIELDDGGGDGQIDLMVASDEAETIYLFQGDASEADGFDDLIPVLVSETMEDALAIDADYDGDMDIVMAMSTSTNAPLILLRNDGAIGLLGGALKGTTWSKQEMIGDVPVNNLTSGDLNPKDEDDDWVISSGGAEEFQGKPSAGVMEQSNALFSSECIGDLNDDGAVNVNDILALISVWECVDCVDEDVNSDGIVDVSDLLIVIAAWGVCP